MCPAASGRVGGTHFFLESLFFRARDWLASPGKRLQEVGLASGWQVLDFGCGVGGHTLAAARLVGETGLVFAVDRRGAAIDFVKNRMTRARVENVRTIRTDCDTGLPDHAIDAVLLYDVLHDLVDPERVLAEFARILKPGGIISVADHHLSQEQLIARLTASGRFRLRCAAEQTFTFVNREGPA